MQKKKGAFNYGKLLQEINSTDDLTVDELILGAEIYYRINDFDNANRLLNSVEDRQPLSERLKAFRRDIVENKKRELFPSAKVEAHFFFGTERESSFASCMNGENVLISKSSSIGEAAKSKKAQKNQSFLSLYEITKNEAQFSGEKELLKNKDANIGPIAHYPGGYIVTQNYGGKLGQQNLKLTFLSEDLQPTGEFPFNDVSYSVGHACYDSVRSRLIFVSDMPLGDGATDLWYSELSNGTWEKPVRMDELNTPGNEMFPTIDENTLYFSSNGRIGFGGLDIYKCELDSTRKNVSHLQHPINSKYDDFQFFWVEKEREALLSSNRSENKNDNVYRIVFENGTFGCEKECNNESCRQFSVEDFEQMDYLRYEFFWDFGDGLTEKGMFTSHCYAQAGTYEVVLDVIDRVTNERFEAVMTNEITIDRLVANYPMFQLESAVIGEPVSITDKSSFMDGTVAQCLWETSEGKASKENNPVLRFETIGYHWVKRSMKLITEEGCCYNNYKSYIYIKDSLPALKPFNPADIDGSDALDAGTYITAITFDRIEPEEPILVTVYDPITKTKFERLCVSDTLFLSLSHNQEYTLEAINTQEKAVSKVLSSNAKTEDQYSHYHIPFNQDDQRVLVVQDQQGNNISLATVELSGVEFKTNNSGVTFLPKDQKGSAHVSADGYWNISQEIKSVGTDTVYVYLTKLELNKALNLDNIHFDLGKHAIRKDAAEILDQVASTLMEYPTIHIELGAHTDSRGSTGSNFALSQRRAKSAVEYLVKAGISDERISFKGYGESKLLNKCENGVKCSEEAHQKNRRIEVVIKKI